MMWIWVAIVGLILTQRGGVSAGPLAVDFIPASEPIDGGDDES